MMEQEEKQEEKSKTKFKCGSIKNCGGGSCIWFLGFIGAAVFYIQQATSFGAGILGVLKALIWPAMLVYQLLQFLGL